MKKITLIILLTIMSFLLLSLVAHAEIRVDITGLKTGCPTGFSLLRSGSKQICEQVDPKIVDVSMERTKNATHCPSGYEMHRYGEIQWCIKRVR